jgi:stage II sporulation protein D
VAATLVAALLGAGGAEAGEPAVRVLLARTADPFWIQGTQVQPAGDGLRAGSEAVGPMWRIAAEGPMRAGSLRVRGSVEVHRAPDGMWVVNQVPLEAYVAGTVGREVYPGWPPEVLKAQAVVARTYALHQRALHSRRPWHLEGGTSGQVYGGVDAEADWALRAARETRGQYLTWRGRPILAVYHSASGGRTAASDEVWGRPLPYLISQDVDDEEASPDAYWRVSIPGPTLGRALDPLGIRVGRIHALRVAERSPSGRAARVVVAGSEGSAELSGRALRAALGMDVIRSTLFDIRSGGDAVVFVGSGHGHGVGMSQWGARALAEGGAGYRQILERFYPGTVLAGMPR